MNLVGEVPFFLAQWVLGTRSFRIWGGLQASGILELTKDAGSGATDSLVNSGVVEMQGLGLRLREGRGGSDLERLWFLPCSALGDSPGCDQGLSTYGTA